MSTFEGLNSTLAAIKTQVWAVVYAYDPPRHPRSLWYDRWRYEIINDYVEAVSFLGAEPLIIDVDSFIVSSRLQSGEIDVVINLNSGATPISNLGLVPSIAEWNRLPCFPCPADILLSGERKDICKCIFGKWFNIPKGLTVDAAKEGRASYIVKPKTMGNSQQVSRTSVESLLINGKLSTEMMVEEFIEGYEVTAPVIFDFSINDYVVLSPIIYVPDVPDPKNWYLSYEMKMDRRIHIERNIGSFSNKAIAAIKDSSSFFNFPTLARLDFRWQTTDPFLTPIELEKLWFLEINCMPTLRTDVNFLKSVKYYIGSNSDALIDYVKKAKTPDIAAMAYLMMQFYLNATKTK